MLGANACFWDKKLGEGKITTAAPHPAFSWGFVFCGDPWGSSRSLKPFPSYFPSSPFDPWSFFIITLGKVPRCRHSF